MKIFVTGATGVLGRAAVPRLLADGAQVLGLARSQQNCRKISEMGAEPVKACLFDPDAMAQALQGADALIHLATHLPRAKDLKRRDAWTENDRVRRDGTRALITAADTAGVATILYPSVVFAYADGGTAWLRAADANLRPIDALVSTLDAEHLINDFAARRPARRGIVLRFGMFYGPQSPESRQLYELARRGFWMPMAPDRSYKSMIWIEDAASALCAALASAPSGVYDVVEDRPCTQAEAAAALAQAVGRQRLFPLPHVLLRLLISADLREVAARSQRISNEAFRAATDWRPAVPDQRTGWARIAEALAQDTPPTPNLSRPHAGHNNT
ncbi:MAG: NAD(P)-dependent oxidoreductase [Pseudomonadota bacterium]